MATPCYGKKKNKDSKDQTQDLEDCNVDPKSPAPDNSSAIEKLNASKLPTLKEPEILKDIDQIASMKDAGARNIAITEMYHKLSTQLDMAVNPDAENQQKNANWATFAVWASREVGQAIRGEAPAMGSLPNLFLHASPSLIVPTIIVQSALAKGNQKVFKEIAPAFAMFSSTFAEDQEADPKKMEAFQKWLAERGSAPGGESTQENLGKAFSAYYEAKFEKDPDRKAELYLKANALIGAHEQAALQTELEAAVPSPKTFFTNALDMELPATQKAPRRFGGGDTLYMDTEVVNVSEPMPGKQGKDGSPYASGLETVDDPELQEIISMFDQDGDASLASSATENWASYADRMDFILNLFRVRQDDSRLFVAPYAETEDKATPVAPKPAKPEASAPTT